jgi:diaminopimelate decarboxylase/aspartate kinase
MSRPWVVLKFGGTSVSSAGSWATVADRARDLLPERRVWIVASALEGVTNLLETAIDDALDGNAGDARFGLRERHRDLAAEIGLSSEAMKPVERIFEKLERRLEGVRLTGEISPGLRARLMSAGELASTRLGAAALARHGLAARWVDARNLLTSRRRGREVETDTYLEARVDPGPDVGRGDEAAQGSDVVLTQGFIARTEDGKTCLLGRGGSDTSAALFAVLLDASELEIWTDVPGLFTADPRIIPSARLLRGVGYREAQELAALGAKILHPRCLPPVAAARIPLRIRSTRDPEVEGTLIRGAAPDDAGVTAVTCRTGTTLITLSTLAMWETPGYLARVFAPFAETGISVDLVGTSQAAVSVTLDRVPDGVEGRGFRDLVERLESLGDVQVRHPCAVVSIVGRRIRSALHELGPALAAFRELPVHLVSDSSEDLNLSFVVDEEDAGALVARLHGHLISAQGGDPRLGPTWEKIRDLQPRGPVLGSWWCHRRGALCRIVADGRARYAYYIPEIRRRAAELRSRLASVERFYYSMKANAHPAVLEAVTSEGFGIECVSADEIRTVRKGVGVTCPVLFTPNFCAVEEYRVALEAGAEVTVDGPEILEQAPDLFRGAEVGLRIDPGQGLGHHPKVRTAGAHTKFGLPAEEIDGFLEAGGRHGVRVVGLHAHVGSGILDPEAWARTGASLAVLAERFADLRWLDMGGGLGVTERPGDAALDLDRLEASLAALRSTVGRLELRLEPGRYVVSHAGVLLAPVNQVRRKGGVNFIGVATGMNSLVRPALYGAWHNVHNLTRLDEPARDYWHVVGPICESSDVLARDRWLPRTEPGDVLLIENAGAYGAVMASRYNLREPAEEIALES